MEDGDEGGKLKGDISSAFRGGKFRFKKYRYRKVLVPSPEQLNMLGLRNGENEIVFELDGCPPLVAQLFVWPDTSKIVVTDIENVITNVKGGGWGMSFLAGGKGLVHHKGSIKLLSKIVQHGYQVIYIASSSSSSSSTLTSKAFLRGIVDPIDGSVLPPGPIFKSPDSLVRAFGAARTDVFKAAALRGLKSLFPDSHNPYHTCFNGREQDMRAISRFGFPESRVYYVNSIGEIRSIHRTATVSFDDLHEYSNEIFPEIHGGYELFIGAGVGEEEVRRDDADEAINDACVEIGGVGEDQEKEKEKSKEKGSESGAGAVARVLSLSMPIPRALPSPILSPSPIPRPSILSPVKVPLDDTYSEYNYWKIPLPTLDIDDD
jgi:hypothetical protein